MVSENRGLDRPAPHDGLHDCGFLVAYWMGEKFDAWNDKMLAVMHEQTAAQVETGKVLQELAVRVNAIERKLEK